MNNPKGIDGYKNCLFCNKLFPYRKTLKARGIFSKPLNLMIGSINQKFCSRQCIMKFNSQDKGLRERNSRRMLGNKLGIRKLRNEERIARRERNLGDKSPFWKGGVTNKNKIIRNSLKYTLWRESIFERDNFTCQICNVRGGKLQADHIKPFAYFPELRFDLSNGRTLCIDCHKKTDTYLINKPPVKE